MVLWEIRPGLKNSEARNSSSILHTDIHTDFKTSLAGFSSSYLLLFLKKLRGPIDKNVNLTFYLC
jgi:hypothetical protein